MMLSGCDVTIARGLHDQTADELALTLNRRGVAAHKLDDDSTRGRYRLEIAASSVETAFQPLLACTLPSDTSDTATADQDNAPLIPTLSETQRHRAQHLARELTRSIELLPGVRRARVHITLPVETVAWGEPNQPRDTLHAAVLLVVDQHSEQRVAQVQRLLAGALPGIEPSAISVVDSERAPPAASCAELSHIGAVTVTKASAATLKSWLLAGLLVHMALASALLLVLARRSGPRERG